MVSEYPLLYTFHFYLFGLIAIASAIAFVTRKSPVPAALWLVNVMISLAALYVMLDAHFIGAIQVLVYAGAIMVVFLFVVMLLNLGHPDELADVRSRGWQIGGIAIALVIVALLASYWRGAAGLGDFVRPAGFAAEETLRRGAVGAVARPLFNEYLLAFEVTSVLLLAAIVGAVAIGRRKEGVDHQEIAEHEAANAR
jgi:NADH-quinone oxidoreductase subunit J